MESWKKGAAVAAAAVATVGGGAAKFGDDIARSLRAAPDQPPIGAGAPEVVIGGVGQRGGASAIEAQLDTFATAVGDGVRATPEAARDAAVSATCEVLYIAYVEVRLPTGAEWVEIGVSAVEAAAIDVPVGSPAWRQLQQVEKDVAAAVSDELGFVDDEKADSIAQDLACAWT